MNKQTFQQLQTFLVQKSGLYFSQDRINTLEEKIDSRLKACHLESSEQYFSYLQFNQGGPAELKNLIDSLTIGETFFFRNEPQFEVLKNFVLPQIIQQKNSSPKQLKIWSAGCSTGAEPYSIAIILNELGFFHSSWEVSLLATDTNRLVLEAASRGIYSKRAVHTVPPNLLNRYFSKRGEQYHLIDEVKNRVKFQYHNLASETYNSKGMQEVDLLFCRNVTIYFDLPTIKRVISQFANSLLPQGYLFIGHAETLWGISDAFDTIEFPQTFIYQKRDSSKPKTMVPFSIPIPSEFGKFSIFPHPAYGGHLPKEEDGVREKSLETLMSEATLLANQEKYKEALEPLEQIIRQDNLNLTAYYLKAVLLDKTKQLQQSIEAFRKVLYIDENFILGYFNLGRLYQVLGKRKLAEKEYSNCLKILEKAEDQDLIPFSEGLTVDILRQAIQRGLDALGEIKK